jgi:hypothetical protein
MAAISAVEAAGLRLGQVRMQVEHFERGCVYTQGEQHAGRFTPDIALAEVEKLKSAFTRVLIDLTSIQEQFVAEHGGAVRDGLEPALFAITELEARTVAAFKATMGCLGADAGAAIREAVELEEKGNLVTVYVYYDGPGELFIRGQGAELQMPAEESAAADLRGRIIGAKNLSWERGLPLSREADHLWRVNLVARPGETPEYKLLISDCVWSAGGNYKPGKVKQIDHIPAFERTSSLKVPVDVGFGNKVVICGRGNVTIGGRAVELSWERPLDLICVRSNLWVLPFTPAGDVEYKICVLNKSGELLWEKGLNRHAALGKEEEIRPDFGPGIVKSGGAAGAGPREFAPSLLLAQERMRAQLEEERKHAAARVAVRQIPCMLKAGSVFKKEDIVKVNEPVRIETVRIDDADVTFQYTVNDKAIFMQEAPEGCSAGTSAMLIVDNGRQPRLLDLRGRVAANYQAIADDITRAGLAARTTPVMDFGRSVERLRAQILAEGPAVVRIQEGVGAVGHFIVVDEISADLSRVRIRDPWHSWECIVTGEAFRNVWHRSLDQCEAIDHIVQVRGGRK